MDEAEAEVVVAVAWVVPVAIGGAAVRRVVVPTAAAVNAIGALWSPPERHCCRNFHVRALAAKAQRLVLRC